MEPHRAGDSEWGAGINKIIVDRSDQIALLVGEVVQIHRVFKLVWVEEDRCVPQLERKAEAKHLLEHRK